MNLYYVEQNTTTSLILLHKQILYIPEYIHICTTLTVNKVLWSSCLLFSDLNLAFSRLGHSTCCGSFLSFQCQYCCMIINHPFFIIYKVLCHFCAKKCKFGEPDVAQAAAIAKMALAIMCCQYVYQFSLGWRLPVAKQPMATWSHHWLMSRGLEQPN